MSYSIIAAIGKNNELGKDNDLIWHLKEDMKFFKETTMGHPVVMGRKTFESLPKVLPGRTNIVLSRSNNFPKEVLVFKNIDELNDYYKNNNEEIFIIGGASIYNKFINLSDKLYLTLIDDECKDADTYFPSFDENDYYKEVLSEVHEEDICYKHVLYKRK